MTIGVCIMVQLLILAGVGGAILGKLCSIYKVLTELKEIQIHIRGLARSK